MKRIIFFWSYFLSLLICCVSCSSLYLEEFDTPVYEGVKNYSLTDLERSIVEMPGDKQDVLMGVPALVVSPSCSCTLSDLPPFSRKVWICDQISPTGELEVGHYQVFLEEKLNVIE
jgi:hypothetical protein